MFDAAGNSVKHDPKKISFTINGEAKLLGVDSGWKNSVEKFQSNEGTTHNGKILLIVQAKDVSGTVEIMANASGCSSDTVKVLIQ